MELTDIMALVKAGYTKEEIAQIENPGTPEPAPAPEQAPVVEPVAPPAPAQQEAQPTMAELMQSIAKLTSAVQANAIAQSVIPQGLQKQPTAEDMIAEIIRPTVRERG